MMTVNSPATAAANPKAQQVLEAARQVFFEQGFSAATTDMIQQAAGVSKSTVYAHYPSKEALFTAVMEAECDRYMRHVQATSEQAGSFIETLRAVSRAYLQIILSPTGIALHRTIIAEAPRFPEIAARFYEVGPLTFRRILSELFARADAAGEIRIGASGLTMAAAAFASFLRGELQLQLLIGQSASPPQAYVDHWIDTGIEMFLRAHGHRWTGEAAQIGTGA